MTCFSLRVSFDLNTELFEIMGTNRKRIQAYVNLSTYDSLKSQAEERGISVSEFVGEILQTYNVGSFQNTSSDDSDSFVTKSQLASVLEEFRQNVERVIIREVNKAELHWQANANALVNFDNSLAKAIASYKSGKSAQDELDEF